MPFSISKWLSESWSKPWFSAENSSTQQSGANATGHVGGVSIKQTASLASRFSFFKPSTWFSSSSSSNAQDTVSLTDFFKGIKEQQVDEDFHYEKTTRTPQTLEQIQSKLNKLKSSHSSALIVGTPDSSSAEQTDSKKTSATKLKWVISLICSSQNEKEVAAAAREAGVKEAKSAIEKALSHGCPDDLKLHALIAFNALFIKPLSEDKKSPEPLTVTAFSRYVDQAMALRQKNNSWLGLLMEHISTGEKTLADVKKWIQENINNIPSAVGKKILDALEGASAKEAASYMISEIFPVLMKAALLL